MTLNSGPHNERDSFVPTIAGSLVITRLSVSISQIQRSIAQSSTVTPFGVHNPHDHCKEMRERWASEAFVVSGMKTVGR